MQSITLFLILFGLIGIDLLLSVINLILTRQNKDLYDPDHYGQTKNFSVYNPHGRNILENEDIIVTKKSGQRVYGNLIRAEKYSIVIEQPNQNKVRIKYKNIKSIKPA